jgi:hypothetical protein
MQIEYPFLEPGQTVIPNHDPDIRVVVVQQRVMKPEEFVALKKWRTEGLVSAPLHIPGGPLLRHNDYAVQAFVVESNKDRGYSTSLGYSNGIISIPASKSAKSLWLSPDSPTTLTGEVELGYTDPEDPNGSTVFGFRIDTGRFHYLWDRRKDEMLFGFGDGPYTLRYHLDYIQHRLLRTYAKTSEKDFKEAVMAAQPWRFKKEATGT